MATLSGSILKPERWASDGSLSNLTLASSHGEFELSAPEPLVPELMVLVIMVLVIKML
jgi:hypothetical protein